MPKQWETAHTSVARLYRRLVVAVDAAEGAVRDLGKADVPSDRLEEAAVELRSQAVSMTRHLVVASRLPLLKRRRALRPIRNRGPTTSMAQRTNRNLCDRSWGLRVSGRRARRHHGAPRQPRAQPIAAGGRMGQEPVDRDVVMERCGDLARGRADPEDPPHDATGKVVAGVGRVNVRDRTGSRTHDRYGCSS